MSGEAVVTPPAATWFAGPGFDDLPDEGKSELTGYMTSRGWDKTDARTAALGAIKAAREAQKFVGAPPDKIIRLPKDEADEAGWNDLRSKLGVPADPKEYDFSGVKRADGSELDADLATALRTSLREANVAKDRAPAIAKAVADQLDKAHKTSADEYAAAVAQAKDALKANWGNNYNANMIVAQNAAKALGIDPEKNPADRTALNALEAAFGYDRVMELFRNVGSRIGEDKFVVSTAPGAAGVMSSDQARASLAERKADKAWVDKLMKGDTATKREFDNLTRMIQ